MEITTPHVAMDDEFQTHNVLFKKELPMRAKNAVQMFLKEHYESSSAIADAGKTCGLLRPHG